MTTPQTERELPDYVVADAVEAFLRSTGQSHSVTQLQRDLTTKCMRAAIPGILSYAATLTRPAASDAVRGLVAKWRREADENEVNALEADSIGINKSAIVHDARSKLLRENADELERALAAPAVDGGECEHRHEVVVNRPSAATSSGIGCLATGGRCVPGTTADCPKPAPPADAEQRARELLEHALNDYRPEERIKPLTLKCAAVRAIAQALRERPAQVEGYIATVPDNCDRIIWRGHYHHLPLTTPPPAVDVASMLAIADRVEGLLTAHGDSEMRELRDAIASDLRILAQQPGVSNG